LYVTHFRRQFVVTLARSTHAKEKATTKWEQEKGGGIPPPYAAGRSVYQNTLRIFTPLEEKKPCGSLKLVISLLFIYCWFMKLSKAQSIWHRTDDEEMMERTECGKQQPSVRIIIFA
jgi:hypothetical protein